MCARLLVCLWMIGIAAWAGQKHTVHPLNGIPLVFEPNRGQAAIGFEFLGRTGSYSFAVDRTGVEFLLPASGGNARAAQLPDGSDPAGSPEVEPALIRMSLAGAALEGGQVEFLSPTGGVSNYFLGSDPSRWRTGIPHYRKVRVKDVWPGIDILYHGRGRQLEYDFIVRAGADVNQIEVVWDGAEPRHSGEDIVLSAGFGELRMHKPVVYQFVDGRKRIVEAAYRITGKTARIEIAEYNSAEDLVVDPVISFAARVGSSGFDNQSGMGVDGQGNSYVAGCTDQASFPATAGSLDSSHNGDLDAFVFKLNPFGSALLYSTFLGGTGRECALGGALPDSAGNVFVSGWTESGNFPTTPGAYQTSRSGVDTDAFVLKLSPFGNTLVYSTLAGGPRSDILRKMAVDDSGAAYLLIDSAGSFPTTAGAFAQTADGVHVVKLNPQGTSLVYATYLGQLGGAFRRTPCGAVQQFQAISVDKAGNAIVAGCTESGSYPTTADGLSRQYGGSGDATLSILNATGSALTYSTFLGGSGLDIAFDVGTDRFGNIYVAGATDGGGFPVTAGAYQTDNGGGTDAFVAKFTATGRLLWSTFVGREAADVISDIATDPSGRVYLLIQSASASFPLTNDAFIKTRPPNGDPHILTVLDQNGTTLLFSSYLGPVYDGILGILTTHGIALDSENNVYICGEVDPADFTATPGALNAGGGSQDVYVLKISPLSPPEPGPPVITSITEAAGFQSFIAPQGWIAIQGFDLATTTRIWGANDFQGNLMPTVLDGTSVKINGRPAGIHYISPTQLNVIGPSDPMEGDVVVEITTPRGTGTRIVRLQRYAPALFLFEPEGRKYPAAVHPNGELIGRAGLFPEAPALTRPLMAGGYGLFFGSGWGLTGPPQPDGEIFSEARTLIGAEHVRVTIGGLPARVEFSGAVGAGLYQFNIVAPENLPTGDHLFLIEFGLFRSQPNVYVSIMGRDIPRPTIESLSPSGAAQGQTISGFQIFGQNLGSATEVRANPGAGLLFSNPRANQNSVTVDAKVALGAAAGQRLISVVTAAGESNSLAFTIRQNCTYSVSPTSISIDAVGGNRSINVQAPSGCQWQVTGQPNWITVTSGLTGSGNGVVQLSVAQNISSSPRSTSFPVATQTVNVTQSGAAQATVPVTLQVDDGTFEESIGAASGNPTLYFVNRLTPPAYPATLRSVSISFGLDSHNLPPGHAVQIRSGVNPVGTADISGVQFTSTPATISRSGTFETFVVPPMTIQSGDFVVGFQALNPTNILPMPYDTTPPYRARSYINLEGAAPVLVNTIGDFAGNFAIRANVEVPGTGPTNPPTIQLLSVTGATQGQFIAGLRISGQNLNGTTQVRANPGAGIAFSNLRSDNSSVTVDLQVAINAPLGQRLISVVTPAGESNTLAFTVNSICASSISPSSISIDSAGGTRTINVQAPAGCGWQVAGQPSWINITSGAVGSGNGVVQLSVAPNTGPSSRSSVFQIANQTLSVTQSGVPQPPISRTFSVNLQPVTGITVFSSDSWFFDVPAGAKRLSVQLTTPASGVDLDLYLRLGTPPIVINNQIVADFRSESLTGSENITIEGAALNPGRYYFAIGQFSLGRTASATVTGTVEF